MQRRKRWIASLLSMVLLTGIIEPVKGTGQEKDNSERSVVVNENTVAFEQSIKENGDGSYTYTVSLSSSLNRSDMNQEQDKARNGYFTASRAGEYLIELWGGSGADGDSTSYGQGGRGGQGGYVYGTISLERGETLFYTIGGNGISTLVTDDGGGANGDGGGHGDIGSYHVGGGGGYSAIYLFEPGEFERKYLDQNGNMKTSGISEQDRCSHYVMIAAGGGGGGAGDGFSLIAPTGRADGGNGGSMNSASGALSGGSYAVSGTFFAGQDGKSSGRSVSYIGKGGTNVPGKISSSFIQLFRGKQPNDWNATNNPAYSGGSGGSGNFRGGAGGAGFSGGSGGIMTELLIPTNVGGGGGGSSFISDEVRYSGLSDTALSKLKGENQSQSGGSVLISYLQKPLQNLTLSSSLSPYFEVISTQTSPGIGFSDLGNGRFSFTDIQLDPDGNDSLVQITVRAKEGFAGGNNVPLFAQDNTVTLTASGQSASFAIDPKMTHANVPLSAAVTGNSLMSNAAGTVFELSALYDDPYQDVRGQLEGHWEYDFISSIGPVEVRNMDNELLSGPVAPEYTTDYDISVAVQLKQTGQALLGPVCEDTVFHSPARITVVSSNTDQLGEVPISYTKTLHYEKGHYVLTLDVLASTQSELVEASADQEFHESSSYTVPVSGYYMIQAWGGGGGHGAYLNGGEGGTGGYVKGYQYFSEGDMITVTVGNKGADGAENAGGDGGGETRILFNDTPVLIAGGGGGGGGGYIFGFMDPGGPGKPVSETVSDPAAASTSQNGQKGEAGIGIFGGHGGKGGNAGKNYNGMTNQAQPPLLPENQAIYDQASGNGVKDNGKVIITCLQTNSLEEGKLMNTARLSRHTLDAQISEYFDILYDQIQIISAEATVSEGSKIQITEIMPEVVHTVDHQKISSEIHYTVRIPMDPVEGLLGGNDIPLLYSMTLSQPSYEVTQDVAQGVNVIMEEVVEEEQTVLKETGRELIYSTLPAGQVAGGMITIAEDPKTDYANVKITPKVKAHPVNRTYIPSNEGILKSSLILWENEPDWNSPLAAFVMPERFTEEVLTPSVTTDYPLTVGIIARAPAEKAVVINEVDGCRETVTATVYVRYPVNFELDHISTSARPDESGWITAGVNEEFRFTLKADSGYVLPQRIEILVGETVISGFSYDAQSGEVVIQQGQITDIVTVRAAADPLTYDLTYIYQLRPGFGEKKTVEKRVGGQPIPEDTFANTYVAEKVKGYDFVWDWATEDGKPLQIMPAQNWFVFGQYIPQMKTLTIRYIVDDTIRDTYQEKIPFQGEYSVVSPVYTGYLADQMIVSGTMPAEDVTIDVHYTGTENQLNILYIRTDDHQQISAYTEQIPTGQPYEVYSPQVEGYEPDRTVISGVMEASGVTEIVYYSPISVIVSFDPAGGSVDVTSRKVIYNNIYGFDGEEYGSLPRPLLVGAEFEGWTLNGQKVDEETVVQTSVDHTLVAQWKKQQFTIQINYVYENGTEAAVSVRDRINYGESYSFSSPEITGYTTEKPVVEGVMGAQNLIINVVYVPKEYELTIHYVDEMQQVMSDPYTGKVAYGSAYEVESPVHEGYTCSMEVVKGTMPAENREITVIYYKDEPVIHVSVEWGNLEFDVNRGRWNPNEHSYGEDSITVSQPGSNTITVINHEDSTVSVDVDLTYSADNSEFSTQGIFTETEDIAAPSVHGLSGIGIDQRKTVYFWLRGSLDRKLSGTKISGHCEVNFRGGLSDGH